MSNIKKELLTKCLVDIVKHLKLLNKQLGVNFMKKLVQVLINYSLFVSIQSQEKHV